MVSRPLHETTQYGKATDIAIAAKLYGYRKCENQNPLRQEGRPGCKHHPGNRTERSGEVFLLDIISHRMSATAIYLRVRLPSAVNYRADRSAIEGVFPDTRTFLVPDPRK